MKYEVLVYRNFKRPRWVTGYPTEFDDWYRYYYGNSLRRALVNCWHACRDGSKRVRLEVKLKNE